MKYKRVYICHPYSSDPEGNIAKVKKIVEAIGKETVEYVEGLRESAINYLRTCNTEIEVPLPINNHFIPNCTLIVPVAAFLALPAALSEGAITREEAMHFCKGLLLGCDEIWVYGDCTSSGMKEEIELASESNIKVVWKV